MPTSTRGAKAKTKMLQDTIELSTADQTKVEATQKALSNIPWAKYKEIGTYLGFLLDESREGGKVGWHMATIIGFDGLDYQIEYDARERVDKKTGKVTLFKQPAQHSAKALMVRVNDGALVIIDRAKAAIESAA